MEIQWGIDEDSMGIQWGFNEALTEI